MKVIDETPEEQAFKPIRLVITIESENELHDLYARLNSRASAIIPDAHPKANKGFYSDCGTREFWNAVKKHIVKLFGKHK